MSVVKADRSWLEGRLNYERVGMPTRAVWRIDRMHRLLSRLGDPHRQYAVAHITGTKGKGSTAFLLSKMLQSAGWRVGLHTSPHFVGVEERMLVDGQPPTSDRLHVLLEEIQPVVAQVDAELAPDQPPLTYFEITTALSLLHFARERVDAAVVEVGMGGRLDATNVVSPAVVGITNVSLDHTRQLGETTVQIIREKAGIIKPGVPTVTGVSEAEPFAQLRQIAEENQSNVYQAQTDFDFDYVSDGFAGGRVTVRTWHRQWPTVRLGLLGSHQAANAAMALAMIDAWPEARDLVGDQPTTDWRDWKFPGRAEVVSTRPPVLLDVAHNEASAQALSALLQAMPRTPSATVPVIGQASDFDGKNDSNPHNALAGKYKRVLVFGSSRDKNWRQFVSVLAPLVDAMVLTEVPGHPRSAPAQELWTVLQAEGSALPCPVWVETDPRQAVQQAMARVGAEPEGLILVTGSFYLVAEVRAYFQAEGLVSRSSRP